MKIVFKSLYRSFVRKPVTNLINLFGLSVSMALVVLLSVYCYSELTTDSTHKNVNRVYLYSDSNNLPRIYTPGVLKDQIDLSIPGVESSIRLAGTWEAPVFQVGNNEAIASDLVFTDPDFFQFFTYQVVEGDLESALKEPMTVVITKVLSERLFGNGNAIGKNVKLNNEKELTVKAVVEAQETNSCLTFSAITSMATRKIVMPNEGEFKAWDFCLFQTFVMLKDGINPSETAKKISSLFPKEMLRKTPDAKLTPLQKLYFSGFSLFNNNYLHSGDKNKVMILLLVAALVLMIALINFVNIASSQWFEKIRQTGVMKINGASRWTVVGYILSEAFLFFLFSLLLAVILIGLSASFINGYTGIQFNPRLIYNPAFLAIAITATLGLSMVFSLIPALRISSSNALNNLKRGVESPGSNSIFSGFLVGIQFSIAIVLITFTILVQKQVYFGSTNPGFNQENTIGIKLTPELFAKKDVLKKLFQENPNIAKVSFTQYYPGEPLSTWSTQMKTEGEKKQLNYDTFIADAGFFETMGLQLVSGRYYSEDLSTDGNKVVVNESFVRQNNLVNPLGNQFFTMNGSVCEIVGVVKDFHYQSFSKPIAPLAMRNEGFASYCLVNLTTGDSNSLLHSIQGIKVSVSKLSPSFPVEIGFLDQAVEHLYLSEIQFRRAFSLFGGCAIVICCLGILSMSLFAAQRRVKEIGIRKVNGAKIAEVMMMLNKDFIKWVGMAFVAATPVAWYIMHTWLESFAYKTDLSWWIFALAGLTAFIIALITVSWQSWKAATRNPVEALRYE